MLIRKIIITLLISILALVIISYAGKQFILERFKTYLIEKVESSTPKGITIKDISYMPLKGIGLAGVTIYKDKFYQEKELYIPNLYIKFSFIKFLANRTFSPTIILSDLQLKNATLNGSFGFSIKLFKKIKTAEDTLESIQNIWFSNFAIKSGALNVRNINGVIYISTASIKTPGLRFVLNGKPSNINFTARMKKEGEIYKIPEIKGSFLNFPFELMGEFENTETPILSLYGKLDIDIEDMIRFAEGRVSNSIYFKVNLKEFSSYELGVKSNADYLKIRNVKFDKFYMDARIKDGVLHVPTLNAYPYNGMLVSSAQLDTSDGLMPYQVSGRLSGIDITALLENTKLANKGISGLLSSEFAIKGNAKSVNSMQGAGNIFIKNANLGPAPLLTPLVGNLYGYFQNLFQGLKKINITGGSCNFRIADRRVSTNNLVLWGEIVSIHARGYIDFDKNLNFEIENRFLEPEETGLSDWEKTLQDMISKFGKLMSRARLTGTLNKPKWKFEYLGGVENIFKGELKGQLENILKDIF
ncbi:MAG: hypothetical protein JSV93_02405 [Candidatus Omnitrophota bacterium]|nr:MAG: hypothetical protein JSV93_02405 [Candidatus Omnitrophota bacterium]